MDSENTEHDHLVLPMCGYLIQINNNNTDQK